MDREALKRWMIAGLMTTNNISCKAFSDYTMRFLFWRAGLNPISEPIALRHFEEEAERVKVLLASELTKLIGAGAILTLDVRQWSVQQQRFLGITLHCSEKIPCIADKSMDFTYRLEKEATAQFLEKTLLDALGTVGLSLTNIRGLTTKDTPVMRELGLRLKNASAPLPFYHLCCFAQMLDMGVLEALKSAESSEITMNKSEADVAGDPEKSVDEAERTVTKQHQKSTKQLVDGVRAVIRASVKSFAQTNKDGSAKRSKGSKRHLRLKIDVRTKWISTHAMLKDFVALELELRRLHSENSKKQAFPLSKKDVDHVKEIIRALDIAEEASTRLWLKDTDLALADTAIQDMLHKLDQESTDFSRRLRRILCVRILQRRGVAPRLARYVFEGTEQTELDASLAEAREEIIASADTKLPCTFVESGDIVAEISSFRDIENEKRRKRAEEIERDPAWNPLDCYIVHIMKKPSDMLPVQELMEKHAKFGFRYNILPNDIRGTVSLLKAVSAPANKWHGLTASAQRFCDEIRDHRKFSDFLLLKTFYNKSKPWETFREVKRMSDAYSLVFASDDDGELCSDCEHEWDSD